MNNHQRPLKQRRHHIRFPSIEELKNAARGRWYDIPRYAGIPDDLLDGRGHPCPKCGGTDRFNAAKDVAESGAVFCRSCFGKSSSIPPGDGIATVAWITGTTNGKAAKWIADHLGLSAAEAVGTKPIVDIIEAVARDRRMPIDAFKLFEPYAETRGRVKRADAAAEVAYRRGASSWPRGFAKGFYARRRRTS